MRSFFKAIEPFWRLGRFHTPIPILLIYLPCVWGLGFAWRMNALAHATAQNRHTDNLLFEFLMPEHPKAFLLWAFLFFMGAVVMRAAGCVFNDMCDASIDQHVERTHTRPLASGQVTRKQAWLLCLFLLALGFGVWLCLSFTAKIWSLGALALLFIYPYTKRFFIAPQLVLGFAFNSGIIIAVAQMEPDLLKNMDVWIVYMAGILWTLYYDTIYAYQDLSDDEKVGVHSTARIFKHHIKWALALFYALSLACFAVIGPVLKADIWFYLSLVGFWAWDVGYELRRWDLSDPTILRRAFHHAVYFGLGIAALLVWPD